MPNKTCADVLIGGKIYTLGGYESEEYLQRVAAYINNKINEFEGMPSFHQLPADTKSVLIELNIADDYHKARTQIEKLEANLELKDKELYSLKHNLITNQIQTENDEQTLKELEAVRKRLEKENRRLEEANQKLEEEKKKTDEKNRALQEEKKTLESKQKELDKKNKELLLNKKKLESSLEEALLGKVQK